MAAALERVAAEGFDSGADRMNIQQPIPGIFGGAQFSDCGKYRYALHRTVSAAAPSRRLLLIMLNPSTADAERNDPTITRCIRFARDLGYAELSVCNLFAYRSTQPHALKSAADPIGPLNDAVIKKEAYFAAGVIVAWGRHGTYRDRDREVLRSLSALPIMALGINCDGTPKHPLYLPANALPVYYRGRPD